MMWPINHTGTNTQRTLELREVVESGIDPWDFIYPSYYQGEAKAEFEKKVLNHFWLRQIGSETIGRFLHYFRNTVREIMPYYIQRYESVDLMKDPNIRPLDNYNMVEEFDAGNTGKTTAKGETSASSSGNGSSERTLDRDERTHEAHSDTPQGRLEFPLNGDDTSDALWMQYASDARQGITYEDHKETSSANETTSTESTSDDETISEGSEHHTLTRRGNIGVTTYAQLLEGYRQTFLNIDMEIINELEKCFLGVY